MTMEGRAPTLTRAQVVSASRLLLAQLVDRAVDGSPEESESVRGLAAAWDDQLAELEIDSSEWLLTESEYATVTRVIRALSDPSLTAASAVEWVDAFPAAVLDLFAPASVDDQIEIAVRTRRARQNNRQPELALAA